MTILKIKSEFREGKISKEDFIHKSYEIHSSLFDYVDALPETDVKKIEMSSEGVFFYVNHRAVNLPGDGLKLYIPKKDERVTPIETFNFNTYEYDDFKILISLISPHDCVFDIGGNIGFHSLNISKKYPETKIYCFEPISATYDILKMNLENNNCKNVQLFNMALSNKEGEAEFFYYPEGSGNASMANLSERSKVEKVKAKLETLDHFTDKWHVSVDFIKCDVEGAELFVFLGGEKVIRENRPIVFTEILRKWSRKFNYDPNDIFNFFAKNNYASFVSKNGKLHAFGLMDEQTLETNFFFIPKEKIHNFEGLIYEKDSH